ncbi:3-deoxy-manno-octulosonate cytidylyltransferase [Candidatus Desantisbacteria bacterium CG2_30_40_21]|uniref:3-deoxy-manno-octulosonate cytidylyltransferase n=4 Tax=unclassified Candidatus Desantisiibacteriota TaxID=3106372 RepID=A0A2M7P1Q1_9BACT|nr:MAG: 3-deoxy-manno-octulosonate cytidylyltransferase [Candidatus Desantisbacteria bacterium CG2_30_40_21]PIP39648.1 MAG: 3-deoxy-manno-octulosonate cytidylyltransferase [Candidatus Desantisbacteria bacterium CG23_combo_of_CG06-09_8_20_14_all_40_23]PIY19540.1 MAG: 3-deoxy-manno-octulosonate cytidylyltransferase [Candidatus Desantisbacteria bacterium CG_4_10_14_3_um_filter_40_18]PJB30188.1 MAG: 3-deoxy-manno-octulosonate cytidylyltransferase [Candidatus Desantisbacteria bacterium CG_4_9_14_3_um
MEKAIGIIPVRFASTRFPGKPLVELCGKPMIQWVYEQAKKSRLLEQVIVATDDERICESVRGFGGNVLLTSLNHTCGTMRVAEVASKLDAEIIINIQGDEPLIEPDMIDQVVHSMQADSDIYMATLKKKITNKDEINNPHVVKVVTDKDGYALYFSRAGIPYKRVDIPSLHWYKHIGLYGYRREFLLTINNLPYSVLEAVESLEQLRVLENGYKIKVLETEYDTIGVDTPEDLVRVARLKAEFE